ncbi:MAG: ECF-type sigma factor [Terriglobales bacterium]|jgi:RNA polymerase sigma factor (TIGR02999 family)
MKKLFVADSAQPTLTIHLLVGHAAMDTAYGTEITVLLRAWSGGDAQALRKLIPLVYKRLYAVAQGQMAQERAGHILQNTALVNELYVQLDKLDRIDWQNRNHFYAVCAQLMRRILVGYARAQRRIKRGGGIDHIAIDDRHTILEPSRRLDLVTLDDTLNDLAAFDERMLRIVELYALVGLSMKETAEALNISERTVQREWQIAKAWLQRELSKGKSNG